MHGTRFGAHARRGWQAHVGFQTPEPRTQNDLPHFRAPMHDRLFEDDRKRRIRPSRSDPPTPMIGNTYLGCGQVDATAEPRMVAARSTLFHAANTSAKLGPDEQPKVKAVAGATKPRGYAYDMKGHVKQSIDRYLELSGPETGPVGSIAAPGPAVTLVVDESGREESVVVGNVVL